MTAKKFSEFEELPTEVMAELSQDLVGRIRPILAGQNPGVIGATILDLLAIWLACHPDYMRRNLLDPLIKSLPSLVEVNEKSMTQGYGHPNNEGLPHAGL